MDFDGAAVIHELVLVFIDERGITRRHGVEGPIGKKLEDDLSSLARALRGDISLPLALNALRAHAG